MFFLAIRYLLSRRKQSFFTLTGIFFGTCAFVIISGFFLGFRNYMIDSLVSGDAHIKITKNEDKIDTKTMESFFVHKDEKISWLRKPNARLQVSEIQNRLGWVEYLKAQKEVVAVGMQYSTTVLMSKAGLSQSISLQGVEPEQHLQMTNIHSKMIQGKFLDIKLGLSRIVIGETLAQDLGLSMDDVVVVTSSEGKSYPMKVVGLFSSGNKQNDRSTVYTSLSTAQKINLKNGQINQISVSVKDALNAAVIASQWKKFSSEKVESWDQANASFMSIFKVQDLMRYGTISILLLVAGFGIYNVLSMVIFQKRKDIAILRSLGYENWDILQLFLYQGAILGSLGSVLGVTVGYLISLYLSSLTMVSPSGTTSVHISFAPGIYLNALLLGIGAACVAAYLPSRAASQMTPIEIIRAGAE